MLWFTNLSFSLISYSLFFASIIYFHCDHLEVWNLDCCMFVICLCSSLPGSMINLFVIFFTTMFSLSSAFHVYRWFAAWVHVIVLLVCCLPVTVGSWRLICLIDPDKWACLLLVFTSTMRVFCILSEATVKSKNFSMGLILF